jgi:serine/threonine-protein kinase
LQPNGLAVYPGVKVMNRRLPPPPPPRRSDAGNQTFSEVTNLRQNAGTVIAERYRLLRPLAQGGMGTVWLAHDEQLDRSVAMKFMSPAITNDAVLRSRFQREAKAAARVRTPHVVQVFESSVEGNTPYIVMELLGGIDLHARLKREGRIDLAEAAIIVAQIARGLRAAHDAGVIHRDLKPQNVFLAVQDGELCVKLLDFGVAKIADSAEGTKAGDMLGSPHYMSPEQARGQPNVDHRTDLWSLGVIAFRMVTGDLAFPGENTGDVLVKICTEPLPLASTLAPFLPSALDHFFMRALDRDPMRRFQNATEMAQAFLDATGSVVPAPRGSIPSLPYPGAQRASAASGLSLSISASALRPRMSSSPSSSGSYPGIQDDETAEFLPRDHIPAMRSYVPSAPALAQQTPIPGTTGASIAGIAQPGSVDQRRGAKRALALLAIATCVALIGAAVILTRSTTGNAPSAASSARPSAATTTASIEPRPDVSEEPRAADEPAEAATASPSSVTGASAHAAANTFVPRASSPPTTARPATPSAPAAAANTATATTSTKPKTTKPADKPKAKSEWGY